MHHITVERWARQASPLHARDARAKIIAAVLYLIALGITPPDAWIAMACYTVLLVTAILIARLPLRSILLRAALVLPFAAAFAITTWLAGDHLRAWGLVEKTYLSSAAALVLIATTTLPALLAGLAAFGAPRALLEVVQFLYRYLFVISEQAQHMRLAAASRGGLSARQGFQAAAGMLGVLFARSYDRANSIYNAMLARGYNGAIPAAIAPRFTRVDFGFVALTAALLAASHVLGAVR